jgi:DNA polymerase type B, organellar and viral
MPMLTKIAGFPQPKSKADRSKLYRQKRATNGLSSRTDGEKQTRRGKAIEQWRIKPFIVLDGEGEDTPTFCNDAGDREHIYTMLTAVGEIFDHVLYRNGERLTTWEIFDWLLRLSRINRRTWFVMFSFNYDVNKWLFDIPTEALKLLNDRGEIQIRHGTLLYSITYIPSKIFALKEHDRTGKILRSVTVYDTFGFFQSSFLNTLDAWDIGTPAERQMIKDMKKQRGVFAATGDDAIQSYNLLECKLLLALMNKLKKACDETELYLQSWHGAGAIGNALMKKSGVDKHIAAPDDERINDAILRAFFGGRFQTIQLGEFDSAYAHDLKSAYPAAMTDLPSLTGGAWRYVDTFQEHEKWALYRVSWDLPGQPVSGYYRRDTPLETIIGPFPFRYNRSIVYPNKGQGWYWYPEIQAVRKYYPITIHEGYVFTPANDDKPFTYIPRIFEQRIKYQQDKNPAEKVLKLGYNSPYGKTAQSVGKAPFQSFFYAGYTTSVTRAQVFELAMRSPQEIIAIATDGVFAERRLTTDEEETGGLGGWETGPIDYLLWIQSGVYFLIDPKIPYEEWRAAQEKKGKPNDYALWQRAERVRARVGRKTRGLGKNEVNFAKLRKALRAGDITYKQDIQNLRRFIGLGYAVHVNQMHNWGNWVAVKKELSIYPHKYYLFSDRNMLRTRKDSALKPHKGTVYPLTMWGADTINTTTLSEPYELKGQDIDEDTKDLIEYFMDMDQPEFLE